MNILYHHRTQGTGGEGVHIGQIVRCLRDLGNKVHVISPTDADPSLTLNATLPAPTTLSTFLGFLSRVLPQLLFVAMELAYNITAKRKIRQNIEGVDLIYERFAFFLSSGIRVAKHHKVPFIVEVNELAGEERVRKQVMVSYAKTIEREVFDGADAVICVSNFLKRQIAEMGVDPDKIHVIPNAADADLFDPARCELPVRSQLRIEDDRVVVGFIGWFVSWHNFDLLIDAIGRVKDNAITLLLVGEGELKKDIQALAEQHHCLDNVVFAGSVPHEEIPEYIDAMDICVIPGSNEYRSPIKLFEYMCMGKPVVAPRVEPIEQVTENGTNVQLFEPGDVADFTRALTELADDKQRRERIGNAARALILDKHRWSHNAKAIIDIYNSIKANT